MAYELFFDGFESYGAGNGLDMMKFGYTHLGNAPQFATMPTGRRANTKCLYLVWSWYFIFRAPITPSTHVVCGVALKQTNSNTQIVIQFCEGDTVHAQYVVPGSGQVSLAVGGGSPVVSASSQPPNTWNYHEIGVHCANTGSYEVRVNGSSQGWLPAANADTRNGGTGVINNIRVYCTGSESGVIDDLYLTFGDELKWLGDSRVDRLLLTGNATPQDWTPNSGNAWERLNAGDGYIESATDEAASLFDIADLIYNPLAIHGVKITGLIKKSDAGYREVCLLAKSNTTLVETDPLVLSMDTLGTTKIMIVDPATNAAWNYTGVNALQAGVKVKA